MNFNFLSEGCILYTLIFFFAFFSVIFVQGGKARFVSFCIIVICEILLASLRGLSVGKDTEGYVEIYFSQLSALSYEEIVNGDSYLFEKEPLCYCFFKFISDPFTTYTPYFFILQIIFWGLIANTMVRYSKDPLLSLFIFIVLRYSFFNMTAMRQGLALAVTTFSYRYYENNKKIAFILLVVVASLFHRSALAFLLLLPMNKINLLNRQGIVYIGIVLVSIILFMLDRGGLFEAVVESELMYSGYFDDSGGKNFFTIFSMILICGIVGFFCRCNKQDPNNAHPYNVIAIALLFTIGGMFVGILHRAAMYFGFIIPLLYSNTLFRINNMGERRTWYVTGVLIMLVIYVCTGVVDAYVPYKFFWEV